MSRDRLANQDRGGGARPVFAQAWLVVIALLAALLVPLVVAPAAAQADEHSPLAPFVVHSDAYEAGFHITDDGSKQWLNKDCRDAIEAAGGSFVLTPWARFGSLPAAAPAIGCDAILAMLAGPRAIVHSDSYVAGWVTDGNVRWYTDPACRDSLEGSGVVYQHTPWPEIAAIPLAQGAVKKAPDCADFVQLLGGSPAAPPWELPLPGPVPAGDVRINALGGVAVSLDMPWALEVPGVGNNEFAVFPLDPGPGDPSAWVYKVLAPVVDLGNGELGPGPAFTQAAQVLAFLGADPDITLTPAGFATVDGSPVAVLNFISDRGAPILVTHDPDDGPSFGGLFLPPVGRLWIGNVDGHILLITAEAFDPAGLPVAVDLAEQVVASFQFIDGLPAPVVLGDIFLELDFPQPDGFVVTLVVGDAASPLQVGDVLLEINGAPLFEGPPPPSGPATMLIERAGQLLNLAVVIPAGDPLAGITLEPVFGDGGAPDEEILIVEVFPGTPADLAGIMVGDLLVEIDGRPWQEDPGQFLAGESVEVTIRRSGNLMTLPVVAMAFDEFFVILDNIFGPPAA